ncbi:MAG TPA: murein biosynthesis integral membrane protein MurJ [Pyrinomonadaceae bacterium]|nr:murein biosynthesis integral membrane protein MurJ [Chloracidobacterium sp.]MBP9936067.1 murein biosynthesis integral membrane protein MurJ [Pyrinomonadaceae bacterium]MBK9437677.1 murein biosynthesis integral membrane protein MurJ [Chloracidobacterium sp.]MBK9767855.1 murein biosynthesis integral membrane protein MurJ [Chloracidobacterium sp.]MBL0239723.1 murein biosynthesis integral membrane protein MurJ [Chloracidobacterium sp.]
MNEIQQVQSDESPEELAEPTINTVDSGTAPSTRQTSVARSAGIVSIAVMFSRVLGLIREMIFARYFGAGFLMDAYVVAFRIPNVLRDLFAEGALSVAFVKVFTDYQINKSEAEAWRLASIVFNLLAVILSVICIVGVIFSRQFVGLIASGFSPEKAALATTMTQIMFPFILLVALAAVAMGVLNTKGIFGIPASASTVFNVVSIIFGLLFAYWLSGGGWAPSGDRLAIPDNASQWAIIGMSIGTLIGGGAQLAMQIPSLLKIGFRFSPVMSFADEGLRRVAMLMGPAIIGTSAVQINVMINTSLVSGIDGAQGWLNYAFRLMQFPIGLFGVAVGTAAIPVMSRLASEGRTKDLRDTISSSLNLVFLMTLPSACGLIVLGEPIIRLIYERGAFKPLSTPMTAYALAGYAIGLTGYAAIKILSPAFYALNDAKTPMMIAIASIAVNFFGGYILREWFSHYGVTPETPHGYGHVGVALATSIVALVNFFALALLMRKRIQRLNGRHIFTSFLKIAAASTVLSVVCYFSYHFIFDRYGTGTFSIKLAEAFIPIGLGGIAFVIAAKLLRVAELEQAFGMLRRKLGR